MHRITEDGFLHFCFRAAFPAFVFLFAVSSVAAQMPGQKAPGPPPAQVEQTSHGFRATASNEVLEVTACSGAVIHVVATPEPSATPSPRPWMLDPLQSCPGAQFTFTQDAKTASIKTSQLEVIVNIERGNLTFKTVAGESLLNEGNSIPRTYEPVELNGDHTYRVTDRFSPSITEALYGLGQHQSGMFNYRGATVELGTEQYRCRDSAADFEQGIRPDVEHGVAYLRRQSLPARPEADFDGRQVDRLLLPLRSRDRRRSSRVPQHDRPRAHAAEVGLRLLPVEGPLRNARRDSRDRSSAIAAITFRSMPSCRTGSGGRPRAIPSSIPTITMCRRISKRCTKNTSTR